MSTVNLQSGDGLAYMASYNAAGWSGNVTANPINTSTAEISDTPTWDAGALLLARDPTTRVIASYNGTAGVAFTEAAVGSLVNPSSTWGTTADVMAYLRGNRTLEGTTFRSRTSLLGAVINAEPVISRDEKVLYVASGEGMLHAFEADKTSTDKGKELWAFVPRAVLGDIGQTTARSYAFKTQLDGTPVVGKVSSTGTKLLVGGMGAAGRAYYALDVTAPRSNTEANASTWVKWQFPLPSDTTNVAKIGQTVGKPVIVRLASGDYRVLVTSGYNSTADGKGRLFVLDPADGTVLKEFTTADGSLTNEAGLTHVSAYAEDDGSTRYVYGGDLLGNLWRFDLDAASGSAPHKVAALTNSSGVAQPVTAAPELVSIGTQRVVLVGTGKLLDVTDWGTNATQHVLRHCRRRHAGHAAQHPGAADLRALHRHADRQRGGLGHPARLVRRPADQGTRQHAAGHRLRRRRLRDQHRRRQRLLGQLLPLRHRRREGRQGRRCHVGVGSAVRQGQLHRHHRRGHGHRRPARHGAQLRRRAQAAGAAGQGHHQPEQELVARGAAALSLTAAAGSTGGLRHTTTARSGAAVVVVGVEMPRVVPAHQHQAFGAVQQPVDAGVAELPAARRVERDARGGTVQAVEHAAMRHQRDGLARVARPPAAARRRRTRS